MSRLESRRLSSGPSYDYGDTSPLSSMGNLVDVLLVFVCGLLIALIMAWHVDLENITMIFDESQLVAIDDAEVIEQQLGSADGLEDMGRAYVDPKTGEVFSYQEDE